MTHTPRKISRRAKSAITRRKAVKEGFRSAFEQKLAASFPCEYEYETEILEWEYAMTKKYKPDFILAKKDGSKMYIEAKGRFFPQDRTKMKRVKLKNPDKDIRFIFLDGKTTLGGKSVTTYMDWAEKNGFPAYDCKRQDPHLPPEWIEELITK